jgi:HAMP domain-containing protein
MRRKEVIMLRRLYWLLPNVESARRTADDLLLARVEDRHMHFLARRGTDLGDLHEASVLQKTDVRHAAGRGLFLGGLLGALAAWLLAQFPIEGLDFKQGGVLLMIAFGAAFGVFASTLVGTSVPNSKLRRFADEIEQGKILLMIDVPLGRIEEIQELLERRHPEASTRGLEPTVPAFP